MSLLCFLVQFLAALGVGGGLLWLLDTDGRLARALGRGLALLVAVALGAGALSTLFLIAASIGCASRIAVVNTLLVGVAMAWRWRALAVDAAAAVGERCRHPADVAGILAVAAASLLLAFAAWSPADMIDTWMYHVSVPRAWLREGRMVAFPYDLHSNLHLQASMWYYGGLALAPDDFILPKLTSVAAGIGIALLLAMEVARRASVAAGALVATLWLTTTEMWEFATSAYVDATASFLLVLAMVVMLRMFDSPHAVRWRLAVVCGALLGIGTAVKMTGYLFAPLLVGSWLLVSWMHGQRDERRSLVAEVALMAVAATVFLAPWWIRNVATTGAPLYPYFVDWFPTRVEYLRVAREFRPDFGNLGFFGEHSVLPVATAVRNLHQYLLNAWVLDQNRLVAIGVLALLVAAWRRLRQPPASSSARTWGDVIAIGAVLLVLSGGPRRFSIGLVALLVLHAAGQLAETSLPVLRHRFAPLMIAALAVIVVVWGCHRFASFGEYAMPARVRVPTESYLTTSAMHRQHDPTIRGHEWIAEFAHRPTQGRLLVTEIEPLTLRLDTRLFLNGPMHSANVLRLAVEEQHLDAEGLARWLADHEITGLLTSEPFDTPVLQSFRRDFLIAIGVHDDIAFYELKPAVDIHERPAPPKRTPNNHPRVTP